MKANDNEILTIAGKRVRVAYSDNNNECCCKCLWNNKCLEAPERPAIYCRRYDKDGKYAYFVAAEDTEADTAAQAQLVPSDVQEAEIRRINITPNEVRYVIDAIPSYAGIFITEDDAKKGLAIFKAGMLAERERLASCPAIKGWIARDENGQVWLYAQRPFRNHAVWTTDKGRYFIRINDTFFPSLRWEDEPIEVEIVIKIK